MLKAGSKEFHDEDGKSMEKQPPSLEEEKKREAEKFLQQRFKTFDVHFKDIVNLLDAWDRSQGNIFRQSSPSEKSEHEDPSVNKAKKNAPKGEKGKDKKGKETVAEVKQEVTENTNNNNNEVSTTEKEENVDVQNQSTINISEDKQRDAKEDIGVPHLIIEFANKINHEDICKHPRLPPIEEVLDGMGMGVNGPPIPPPATFSVMTYPNHRKSPPGSEFSHYVFVTNDPNDPNLIPEEKPKEALIMEEQINDGEKSPDNIQAKSQNSSKQKTPKTGTSRNESRGDNAARRTSGDKKRNEPKSKRDSVAQSPNRNSSSLSGQDGLINQEANSSIDGLPGDKPSQKLQRFRWVIPQFSDLVVKLRFTSEEIGQFDQTLSFEITGTRRRYQLHCRGICTFPKIMRDPRVVFPSRKKFKEPNEIVHKKFLLSEELYDFGPLLVGNNKERIREGKFPEYLENLSIQNASPLDAEVSFCFLDDNVDKPDSCFYLEPPEFTLKPNESKVLKVYATPKENKLYEDTLVCCIKENPEPILFKMSCFGQKPELILDKKEFNFKQVLLHRKDSKEIKMTNNTMMPVQWKIEGTDTLGDEFVCNQITGVIDPYCSFNLILHFRALKPLLITPKERKILKVLVSSMNSFLGFMENHLIQVTAEAYDVALEINLPKGNDGGLDFGSIRVNVENKLACTLKNKGKYPIKFK